jgi:AcrR family transcriptional regulator
MAPKLKSTREQIIDTGLEIAREKGIEAITAREVGIRLNLSSRAGYSFFASVDELKEEVVKKIYDMLAEFLARDRNDADAFLKIGLNYIEFAKNQKELYQIIHSTGRKYEKTHKKTIEDMMINNLRHIDIYANFTTSEIKDVLFRMGIFTHGLADMLYQSEEGKYSDSFIRKLMSDTGEALIKSIISKKEGGKK